MPSPPFSLLMCALLSALAPAALEPTAPLQVRTLLRTQHSWDGAPLAYPSGRAEVTGLMVEIAPGAETGWHSHPVPSFALVLEGQLEIRLRSGRIQRLGPGDALAEVVDTAHNGRNVGTGAVRLVVFYAGAVGTPLTRKDAESDGPERPALPTDRP